MNRTAVRKLVDSRRKDGPARAVHHVPTGPGDGAESAVSNDSPSATPVRRDLAEGSTDVTGRTEGHLDARACGAFVRLNVLSAETPSKRLQRRVGPQFKVAGRRIKPTRLGSLSSGSIMAPEEPGGVAGSTSHGECHIKLMLSHANPCSLFRPTFRI